MSIMYYNQIVIYIHIMSQTESNNILCCLLSHVLSALMHCSCIGDRKGMSHVYNSGSTNPTGLLSGYQAYAE